jgi:hypothetical protein
MDAIITSWPSTSDAPALLLRSDALGSPHSQQEHLDRFLSAKEYLEYMPKLVVSHLGINSNAWHVVVQQRQAREIRLPVRCTTIGQIILIECYQEQNRPLDMTNGSAKDACLGGWRFFAPPLASAAPPSCSIRLSVGHFRNALRPRICLSTAALCRTLSIMN